jgi:hypothetical protein
MLGRQREGLDRGEFSDAMRLAPLGKAARGIQVGLARVVVLDLGGEKFEDAFGGLDDLPSHAFMVPNALRRPNSGSRRLEWILRIQAERDASQLLRDTVDVPVDVKGHSLKIAISALEIGTLA